MVDCFGGLVPFKREQVGTATIFCTIFFLVGVSESIGYAVYPFEAESKGLTASQYGLIFGAYPLVGFIICPIWGKYVDKVGAGFLINGGLFLGGSSCILFGLLHYVKPYTDFLVLSFAVIILQALGSTTTQFTTRAVIGILFPETIGTTFAFVEGFSGLGYLTGPTLSAFLYEFAGYPIPFVVVGAFMIVIGVILFFTLPDVDDNLKTREPIELFSLLRITPILMGMICITTMNFGSGFYYTTLEPHLRPHSWSPIVIGLILSTIGGVQVLSSHLIGRVSEAGVNPQIMVLAGGVFGIVGFVLVGTPKDIHSTRALWMTYLGTACEGLCESCVFVGAFIDGMRSAIAHGLPDTIATYGIVSGTLTSSYYLGGFLGPPAAGFLFDNVGFSYGTIVPIVLHVCIVISTSVMICTTGKTSGKNDAHRPECEGGDHADVIPLETREHAPLPEGHSSPLTTTDVTSTSGYESNDSERKHLLSEEPS